MSGGAAAAGIKTAPAAARTGHLWMSDGFLTPLVITLLPSSFPCRGFPRALEEYLPPAAGIRACPFPLTLQFPLALHFCDAL